MKIGLVGPVPPPAGGMAMQTLQLKELLQGEGLHVEMLATNGPYKPAFAEKLKGIRALFRLLPYLFGLWRLCSRVELIHLMANSGWSWVLFSAPCLLIAKLRGTPVVVNYRGGEADTYFAKNAWHVRPVMRLATKVIVPSRFLEHVFARYDLQTVVIPNIVRLERFTGERLSTHDGAHLVITRNLEPIYGIPTAIKALAIVSEKYPQAHLSIAGSGPQLEELTALVCALNVSDNVSFLGRLDRDGIDLLYRSADILLNPTTVDNMPNSLLEAMAAKVCIVSSDVGGVPFMVEQGETALLTPVGDEHAMAKAIGRLLDDKLLQKRLVTAAYDSVQSCAWPVVKSQWLSTYQEVLRA